MIYSFYENCDGRDTEDELRLILLWREHHARIGLETSVLCDYHAMKHPGYAAYSAKIEELTGESKGECRATFLRWMAMATVAGGRGWMMQYNTFLYPAVLFDMNPIFHLSGQDVQTLRVYQDSRPSLVVGAEQAFRKQYEMFLNCQVKDPIPGLTDDKVLAVQAQKKPETLTCMPYVKDFGAEGWETAVAVRYPRDAVMKAGAGARWQAIPKLRKYEIPQQQP